MSFELRGNQVWLDGRHVGWTTTTANGLRVFVSPRNRLGIKGHGHYFEIYESFGLAKSVLGFLEKNHFDEVHLRIGKSETLISKVSDWREKGFPYHHRNYEEQTLLRESDMRRKILTLSELMESPYDRL